MEILNLSSGGGFSPKKSNKLRAVIGVGLIAASIGIGSTLAANININSGPVEFGQGVAQTVACSGEESIIVTPSSTFSNEGADIETVYTELDGGRYRESGWLQVPSTTGITVGMVVEDGDGPVYEDTVVIEVDGDTNVYISKIAAGVSSIPSGGFPVTFSESRGTPATLTPTYHGQNEVDGRGDFSIDTSGLTVGMLISGPGIQSETVITYVESGYIDTSKSNTYASGDLSFTNSVSGIQGSFKLSEITVSNIPDTCNDKVFTIKIYDNTNPEPLKISNWAEGDTSVQIWWANGVRTTEESFAMVNFPTSNHAYYNWNNSAYNNGYAIETNGYSSVPVGAFKVNLPTSVNASHVYKITVESMDDSPSISVGGTGQSFYGYWY